MTQELSSATPSMYQDIILSLETWENLDMVKSAVIGPISCVLLFDWIHLSPDAINDRFQFE